MAKGGNRAKARPGQPTPRGGKTSASVQRPSNDARPVFSFRHVDRASENRWVFRPSEADALQLLTFLCEIERLTWREIESQSSGGHRKHHSQALDTIVREAQRDAERAGLGEIFGDTMFRFRLGSRKRLWGFREESVFYVVWWDPNHKVYPTEPN